jgi:hypothetical protein
MFSFNVAINDQGVANTLGQLALKLQKPAPLSKQIANIVYDSIMEGFDNESDPSGSHWDALAPSTIENRRRQRLVPIKILSATGKGRRAIRVIPSGSSIQIQYGGEGTEYMQYHRKGQKVREFIPSHDLIDNSPRIKLAVERYFNPSLSQFVYGELVRTEKILSLK